MMEGGDDCVQSVYLYDTHPHADLAGNIFKKNHPRQRGQSPQNVLFQTTEKVKGGPCSPRRAHMADLKGSLKKVIMSLVYEDCCCCYSHCSSMATKAEKWILALG